MQLENRKAVITGAAQGIGKALVERFAREGADVAILDMNLEAAQATASEIASATGRNIVAVQVNVTDEAEVEAAMQEASDKLGGLDTLVNNAGVLKSHFICDFDKKDWDFVLNVNLTGAFLCIKHAARHFVENGKGNIVVIGSKSGKRGGLWNHAYCASKFGVIGMVQCVAQDLAPRGIRANVICPGDVMATPLWDDLDKQYAKKLGMTPEQVREHYKAKVPLGRDCALEDVANVAVFLASEQSSYMTGQSINVTGGQIMF